MSEQYNINVQPVLNTEALHEQLNNQKYKINVEIDSAALNAQLQSAVNSVTGGITPAKVPVEMETSGLERGLSLSSNLLTTISSFKNLYPQLKESLG